MTEWKGNTHKTVQVSKPTVHFFMLEKQLLPHLPVSVKVMTYLRIAVAGDVRFSKVVTGDSATEGSAHVFISSGNWN